MKLNADCKEIEGKFVRFGPNSVSVNSATALKDIYGHGKNFRKSDFYKAFPAVPGVHNTHNSIRKEEHGRKRRVLSQAFSEAALKNMEYLVLDNIRLFCDQMEKLPGAKNCAHWFNYLTFDVMGELCFGKAFGMLKDESTRFVTRLIDKAAHRHYIVSFFTFSLQLGSMMIIRVIIANKSFFFAL